MEPIATIKNPRSSKIAVTRPADQREPIITSAMPYASAENPATTAVAFKPGGLHVGVQT